MEYTQQWFEHRLQYEKKRKQTFGCSHKPNVKEKQQLLTGPEMLSWNVTSPGALFQAIYVRLHPEFWEVLSNWILQFHEEQVDELSLNACFFFFSFGLLELPDLIFMFVVWTFCVTTLKTPLNYNGKDIQIMNKRHLSLRGRSSMDYL